MQAEVVEKVKQQVPSLRFSGFKGNWTKRALGEVCTTFKSGEGITAEHINEEGEYPVYGGNGLRGYTDSFTHEGVYVLIGRQGALCGNVNVVTGKSYISEHAIAVSGNELADTEWLGQKLGFVNLNRLSESSAQPGLAVNKLVKLEYHFPTLPEQQKIAAFLGAVDRKIQQLKRKQALLEQYKKGVVQQLFSQELRFKREDGGEYPEWEEATVDECLQTISTRPYQIQSNEFLAEGPIPVVDQGKSRIAGYTDQVDKVIKNDGVIVYGDHTTEVKYIDFDFVVGADGTKLLRSDKHDLRFLYYNLAYNNVEQEGYKRHFTLLREKMLQLPSLEEQSRIAGFLMALDAKVEGVAQAVAAAEKWKKGLLQQMFV